MSRLRAAVVLPWSAAKQPSRSIFGFGVPWGKTPLPAALRAAANRPSPTSPPTKLIGKSHKERIVIGYSDSQLFDVVVNVAEYHMFLPWCCDSRIARRTVAEQSLEAELSIGFKPFCEKYTSLVTYSKPHYVNAVVKDGSLFHHLKTNWTFMPGPTAANTCEVLFTVDFAFASGLHQSMAEIFFKEVAVSMVQAFENRCRQLYGAPVQPMRRIA